MTRLLSRYLLAQTLRGVLVALAVVLVLILLVDFVEQTRTVDVVGDDYGLLDFAGLTLLKTPMLTETTLPFIVLFGVMLTMFNLNRRSELVVMRAAGMSAWRFVTPAILVALVAGILSPALLNPFSTAMIQRFDAARATLTGGVDSRERPGAAWFIESGNGERRLIRAGAVNVAALDLYDVTFLFFQATGGGEGQDKTGFTSRLDAARAHFTGDEWLVFDASIAVPGEQTRRVEALRFPAWLDVAAFGQNANANAISFWGLPAAANAAAEVGVPADSYRLRWLRLLATPLMFAAMALIACAASLRLRRLGGTLRLIVIGGLAGFAVYFLGNMLDAFALGGRMPLILAAGAAPVVGILAGLAAVARFEDS